MVYQFYTTGDHQWPSGDLNPGLICQMSLWGCVVIAKGQTLKHGGEYFAKRSFISRKSKKKNFPNVF